MLHRPQPLCHNYCSIGNATTFFNIERRYKLKGGDIHYIAIPRDENIQEKELKKIDKYQSLKIELKKLRKVRIMVIPVDVGALSAIADRLPGWLAQIPGTISEVELQKSALLGTAQVLRRVLRLPGLW